MVVMDEMEAFERLLVWYVPVVTGQVLRGGVRPEQPPRLWRSRAGG